MLIRPASWTTFSTTSQIKPGLQGPRQAAVAVKAEPLVQNLCTEPIVQLCVFAYWFRFIPSTLFESRTLMSHWLLYLLSLVYCLALGGCEITNSYDTNTSLAFYPTDATSFMTALTLSCTSSWSFCSPWIPLR